MRTLLLSGLFAFGVGLTGIVSASATIGPASKAAPNFSPSVRQATNECRIEEKCDVHGQNCQPVNVCR